jgi:hypothetical protein
MSRQGQTQERISDMKDIKIFIKTKINTHEYNIQELWDIIKKRNLGIHWVEEVAEIQTKT